MKNKKWLLLSALAASAAPCAAVAGASPSSAILRLNNSVEASYQLSQLHYGETINDNYFDTENGKVHGESLGISWMGNIGDRGNPDARWEVTNLYLSLSYGYVAGDVNYQGGIQHCGGGSCTVTPHAGTSHARIKDWSARIGKGIVLSRDFMATPYLGFGTHEWDRELLGANGYGETYENDFYDLGGLFQYALGKRWVIAADVAVGSTAHGNITTPYGSAELGASAYYDAGLEADVALASRLYAFVDARYKRLKYGYSAQAPIAGTPYAWSEPNSTTGIASYNIGLRYAY
ncbi:MAG: hypothetical protein M0T84_18280 [Betaproteobacteria bacterium]|nr:hypothetical protein [Betaproteobacteria bacterium]